MNQYQARTMLVTGGAGFIGSNFIRHVLTSEPKINIVNLDKLTYAGSLHNLDRLPNSQRYHFIQGDITDAKFVKHVMMHHHIDTIVHFAAESHVDRSISDPSIFMHTNVLGTFTLLEAARHHWFDIENVDATRCRFHHISTDEVYGSLALHDFPFTENSLYQPNSPYAASKASSDHIVRAYHQTYGLPITITNCSNNYGPYQHPEKFIPTIIRGCLNQQTIPIYGNGKNIRDWLHVKDHCKAILTVIKHGRIGESYNVGGNNECENIELAQYVCAQMDKLHPKAKPYATLLEFVNDRLGHDFRYAIDSTKIVTELNWVAEEKFDTGLDETIKFYNYQR